MESKCFKHRFVFGSMHVVITQSSVIYEFYEDDEASPLIKTLHANHGFKNSIVLNPDDSDDFYKEIIIVASVRVKGKKLRHQNHRFKLTSPQKPYSFFMELKKHLKFTKK